MAIPSDTLKATLLEQYPLSLENIECIIDRVHQRYPYLNRYEITIIAKSFFETIRYLLLTGNIISINGFATNMRLLTFQKILNSRKILSTVVKLTTPKKMKHD